MMNICPLKRFVALAVCLLMTAGCEPDENANIAGVMTFHIAPRQQDLPALARQMGVERPAEQALDADQADPADSPLPAAPTDFRWMPLHSSINPASDVAGGLIVRQSAGEHHLLVAGRPPMMLHATVVSLHRAQGNTGRPALAFELSEQDEPAMQRLTEDNIGRTLTVVVDGQVIAAPMLHSSIGRYGRISGNFTPADIDELIRKLSQPTARKTPADEP